MLVVHGVGDSDDDGYVRVRVAWRGAIENAAVEYVAAAKAAGVDVSIARGSGGG